MVKWTFDLFDLPQTAWGGAWGPSSDRTPVLSSKAAAVPSAQSLRLLDFGFSDFELSDTETTLATVRMFVDLDLVQNFQMKYTVRPRAGTLGRSPTQVQTPGRDT